MTEGPRSNAEQANYWTEQGGPNWVRDETSFDLMLAPFNPALLDALGDVAGKRVLEVGCGFGSTALALAGAGALVHGVDISRPMIERARVRAGDAPGSPTFAVGDAQEDPLGGPYDAVTSRFGVMFFADPARAFANIARATRAGGCLAFVCWQTLDRNPWMSEPSEILRGLLSDPPPAAPTNVGPFAFGDRGHIHDVLTRGGWSSVDIQAFETPVQMGGERGVAGAVEQALSSSQTKALLALGDSALRARAEAVIAERFAAIASADGSVRFPAATWLVTATR